MPGNRSRPVLYSRDEVLSDFLLYGKDFVPGLSQFAYGSRSRVRRHWLLRSWGDSGLYSLPATDGRQSCTADGKLPTARPALVLRRPYFGMAVIENFVTRVLASGVQEEPLSKEAVYVLPIVQPTEPVSLFEGGSRPSEAVAAGGAQYQEVARAGGEVAAGAGATESVVAIRVPRVGQRNQAAVRVGGAADLGEDAQGNVAAPAARADWDGYFGHGVAVGVAAGGELVGNPRAAGRAGRTLR